MNKALLKDVALLGVGVGAGYLVGFLVSRRQIKTIEQRAQADINEIKESYKLLRKEEFPDVSSAAEALIGEASTIKLKDLANKQEVLTDEEAEEYNEAGKRYAQELRDNGYTEVEAERILKAVTERTTVNVFEQEPESAPEEIEPGAIHGPRVEGEPYVISVEEFMEEDENFEQITLSYWEEDDTLIDDANNVIHDVASVIGLNALRRFGQGSRDPNIVHIKNEENEVKYEVIRDFRAYTEVVLGIPKAPEEKSIRRMRSDD